MYGNLPQIDHYKTPYNLLYFANHKTLIDEEYKYFSFLVLKKIELSFSNE